MVELDAVLLAGLIVLVVNDATYVNYVSTQDVREKCLVFSGSILKQYLVMSGQKQFRYYCT